MMDKPTRSYIVLLLFLVAVIIGMLYFGFRLEGFHPANNVSWENEGPGLSFDRFGIAYTDPIVWRSPGESSFSLEIALQPGKMSGGFHFVLMAHGGDDDHQFVLGQWQSTIIAMHGDDYDNRRRTPKVMVDLREAAAKKPVLLTLVSGSKGTRLYLDGTLKRENRALRLQWPDGGIGAHLVLGNSVFGTHSWHGTITGMALYAHALGRDQVNRNYRAWRQRGDFSYAQREITELLYLLDEGGGEIARDRSGNGRDLIVPAYMKILKKAVLVPEWRIGGLWENTKDVLVNFFGFWPFGFLIAAALERSRRMRRYYIPGAVTLGFFFSLSIELGQVWIPSRTSSLLDLIMNTLGTVTGLLLYIALRKPIERRFFQS